MTPHEQKQRLRILVIEAAGNLWGSERALLDLLACGRGCEYAVCCPPGTPILPELEKLGIRILPWFISRLHQKTRWRRARAVLGVLRACRLFRPHVVYLNQSGCYRIVALACRLLGIPIVAHVRIVEDAAYLAGCRPHPQRLKAVIAISHWIADQIQQETPLARIPVHILYDGYQPTGMEPFNILGNQLPSSGRIACIGRVQKIKGQDLLLEALSILKAQGQTIRCSIVGDGEVFYRELVRKTSILGLEDQVEWTGFLADPRPALRDANVLVLPSHREPLGRVIFEAWEIGLAPVAFAGSGGAAEILERSRGGLLYAEQSPACLAEAIRVAVALPEAERAAMVHRGRTWMAANTDPAKYAAALESLFANSALL